VRFQITRHAHSCNNNPFKKDMDPSLTLSGVLGAERVRQESPQRFQAETVYVSCLIRTWQTAVLLYGHGRNDLTLIVSPHITEFVKFKNTRGILQALGHEASVLGYGNRPLHNSPYETTSSRGDTCRETASQVCKMTDFLREYQQYFAPQSGIFALRVEIPGVIKGALTFRGPTFRVAVDAAQAPVQYTSEHNEDGDIVRFLESLPSETTFAHCVAHSNVMKAFVDGRELSGEQERVYADVKQQKQNVWSVRGSWTRGEGVRIDEIHSGVRAEDVKGEWYAEGDGRDRALCGYG
jgi:phosphohistidine phosphatase SixA